ncbi:MAG: FmdB family transcriptional regulator [Spirochaetales bacterium]|nr:FmdB family transcriptional regulator [Spirochaetales bacterium]
MPTYDYACDSCGNRFEVFQKMSDQPVNTCPSCGKAVRRVLSGGVGISFKGSGFYKNDSAPSCGNSTACANASCGADK